MSSAKDKAKENLDTLAAFVDNYHNNTPYSYVCANFPNEPPKAHHKFLLDLVQRCTMKPTTAALSMPPGHSKSTTLMRALAWWISTYPKDTHAYITYGQDLSWDMSRKIRSILTETSPHLKFTTNRVESWAVEQGGGLFATGIGGPLTGKRVSGLLIVDDPYKNMDDARSPEYRAKVSEWFKTVAMTRLQKGASVIVVHTRWSDHDLISELVKEHGYLYKNFPAINEAGEALWPEQYDIELLQQRRSLIGEANFSALYQGKPVADGARVFQEPTFYDPRESLTGWTVYIAADCAASAKQTADFSCAVAIATKGKGEELQCRVISMIHGQWTMPEFARRLNAFQMKWFGCKVGIEANGGFIAVPQMLREMTPRLRIKEIHPKGDKLQRAQPLAAAWNEGRVQLPNGAPFNLALVNELTAFTGVGDVHDDIVDALAHAFNMALAANQAKTTKRGAVLDFNRYR